MLFPLQGSPLMTMSGMYLDDDPIEQLRCAKTSKCEECEAPSGGGVELTGIEPKELKQQATREQRAASKTCMQSCGRLSGGMLCLVPSRNGAMWSSQRIAVIKQSRVLLKPPARPHSKDWRQNRVGSLLQPLVHLQNLSALQ